MANTKFRDLGLNGVCQTAGDDGKVIGAIGDGTAKPGDLVSILSTGKVAQTDVGVNELFVGVLMRDPVLGLETAIPDTQPCSVKTMTSGRDYAVRIENPAGTEEKGQPMTFSDTGGSAEAAATAILGILGNLAKPMATGDTIGVITKA